MTTAAATNYPTISPTTELLVPRQSAQRLPFALLLLLAANNYLVIYVVIAGAGGDAQGEAEANLDPYCGRLVEFRITVNGRFIRIYN